MRASRARVAVELYRGNRTVISVDGCNEDTPNSRVSFDPFPFTRAEVDVTRGVTTVRCARVGKRRTIAEGAHGVRCVPKYRRGAHDRRRARGRHERCCGASGNARGTVPQMQCVVVLLRVRARGVS